MHWPPVWSLPSNGTLALVDHSAAIMRSVSWGLLKGPVLFSRCIPKTPRTSGPICAAFLPTTPSYALTFRFVRPDGRQAWLEEAAKGEFDSAGKLLRINGLTRDITERKELEDHKNTLISELDHRVKNVLATVLTVASRTQETSTSMSEFVAALEGRIKSMATTHELLRHPTCGTRAP
jgi:hypothetical protein